MEQVKNTYLVWRGASLWDGEEIAVIVTGLTTPSSNRKTGPMLQTWILTVDAKPTNAVKSGQDAAACGDCPLRGGACYVNLVTANTIYATIDSIPKISRLAIQYIKMTKIGLRIGSYGDPAMAPFKAWEPLIKAAGFHLGYTHQWKWCDSSWKQYLQASVDDTNEMLEAKKEGWGTFRVKLKEELPMEREMICPNQKNSFIKCSTCRLCNGNYKKHICVDVHGAPYKIQSFKKLHKINHSHAKRPIG